MTVFDKKDRPSHPSATDLAIPREAAMRGRVRVTAPDGEEVIIDLPRGERIYDGDEFGPSGKGTYFRASILPERVAKVSFRGSDTAVVEHALQLGYYLGNRHLEVLVEGNTVFLPLTLGADKIEGMVRRTGLPVDVTMEDKVISPAASGYFGGEEEDEQ
ncbi:MAG: hypothetical protein LUQ13_03055 [Methanomicrobiales archaeon]|nr:hypothetical protein [Methanomicrobiales archaeon]